MVEIVAEISGNHDGSIAKMCEMIGIARDCGCDYAKFQFYRPEDMPDRDEADNDSMYRRLMVPDEWLPDLFRFSKDISIGLFASVFSVRAVETLLKFDVPYIKIASPESTRLPLKTYQEMAGFIPYEIGLVVSSGYRNWGKMRSIFSGSHMIVCPSGHPPHDAWEYLFRFNPV